MLKRVLLVLLLIISFFRVVGQKKENPKTQFTNFLANSYYSLNFGGIFYPFSNDNLIEGYQTETFSRNWFSGRLLLGHKLSEEVSVQFGTMRPASWFKYDNINNIGYENSVWINAWSLSLKRDFTISDKTSIYAEAGIDILLYRR